MISKEKLDALAKRLEGLEVKSCDLTIKYILGSGPGGQKINKTASTVYIKHLPTGFEIKYGKDRSRELNRYRALTMLCEKMEKLLYDMKSKKEQELEKKRRQKKRRTRRTQQKLLEDKRQTSEKKTLRKSPDTDKE